ncbi:MAG: HEAT repeat domain-containing protein [Pseudomonadota bacterium]
MQKEQQKELIIELKQSFAKADLIKAKAVLQYLDDCDADIKKEIFYEFNKINDDLAFPLLAFLAKRDFSSKESKDKIFSLLLDRSVASPHHMLEWLAKDDNKYLIRITGVLQMDDSVPILLSVVAESKDKIILVEAIDALGRIGAPAPVNALSEFLYADDNDLREVAILALSKIGGPTVISRLSEALGKDGKTDSMIFDALAVIQDQRALEKLNDILMSRFPDLRNKAKDYLVMIGAKAVPILIENLKDKDPNLLVHSLNTLGRIGDQSAVAPIRRLVNEQPENANVRFAAYEALGLLPSSKSAISLAKGLSDSVSHVRVAAARAIDKNLSDALLSGINNMIESGDQEGADIVATFIDAQADNVFEHLITSQPFQDLAVKYLIENVHPGIRDHFLLKIQELGMSEIAEKIKAIGKKDVKKKRLKVYAVDDSRLMINIYMKALNKLQYDSICFEKPSEALKVIKKAKPDILLTDLNMPDMNGLELTRQIRLHYPADQLPIIMITTQDDFQEIEVALGMGVDAILNKPFKDEELASVIERLILK